ncbi:MmyB family transcriptional regulator [Dactylosporangium cerinum]
MVPFNHPQVGELRLNREKLLISGTDGIMLVVYHPDPGTPDADKLALLGAASAGVSAGGRQAVRKVAQ